MYRLQSMSACPPPACELRVLQCDDDELGTATRPCLEAAIGGSTTLVGAMMRYHTIMARINKEAVLCIMHNISGIGFSTTSGASARAKAPAWGGLWAGTYMPSTQPGCM